MLENTIHCVMSFQLGIPRVYFANSSGLDSMLLCHHNISKSSSHDLTLLPLTTIVKVSLTISTGEPGHDHKCEAVH